MSKLPDMPLTRKEVQIVTIDGKAHLMVPAGFANKLEKRLASLEAPNKRPEIGISVRPVEPLVGAPFDDEEPGL